ncbi:MAG TPA: oligopeptide/dipeptide ABC transporter ATP-binding protein [Chloroflexota bacterium]|nr:oligopeptide/dipeptide ABC transporter ATP-binding protein [Chloroflexota bacterium]
MTLLDQPSTLNPQPSTGELLRVEGLVKYFPIRAGFFGSTIGHVRAVDGVSFGIKRGEAFGLVGESGCGKTTLAQTVIRLYKPSDGRILFDGVDLASLGASALRPIRRRVQMIFQDPYASLDPRMTVGHIVGEPLEIYGVGTKAQREARVAELLKTVGLNAYMVNRYPHEFSGGQRQRIGIARALALQPELVICDEPVSALDVSIQAQVLNLLRDLQSEFGLTYLFIAHNLAAVAYVCDRIGVMYLGKLVELGTTEQICTRARHPYTKALLSAVPIPAPGAKKERIVLGGDVPSPVHPPSGCRFRTRCPIARDDCAAAIPPLREVEPGHWVSCFYAEAS